MYRFETNEFEFEFRPSEIQAIADVEKVFPGSKLEALRFNADCERVKFSGQNEAEKKQGVDMIKQAIGVKDEREGRQGQDEGPKEVQEELDEDVQWERL